MSNFSLLLALETFLKSSEKHLQLDVFRSNNEIVLQIFKGYDVQRWDIDFDIVEPHSAVLQLIFNNNKTNNSQNLERFLKSDFTKTFQQIDFHGQMAFFYSAPISLNVRELENEITLIIKTTYDLNPAELYWTLNAY